MFGKKKIIINAMIDSDIEKLLRQTEQFEELLSGGLQCKSCKTTITVDNIGILVPHDKEGKTKLDFYCERIDCMEEYKKNGQN